MSLLQTFLPEIGASETTLEAWDRRGECRLRIDGSTFSREVGRWRAAFGEIPRRPRGLRPVALLFRSDETIEFLVAAFAAIAEGCTVVPLYPTWSRTTQHEYLRRYRIDALAVADGFRERARGWKADLGSLIEIEIAAAAPPRPDSRPTSLPDLSAEHPCAWIFTSGTSGGFAKCTEITLGNLAAAAANIRSLDFLHPGMTVHMPLSVAHVFAFSVVFGFLSLRPRRVLFSDVQYISRLSGEGIGKIDGLILVPLVIHRVRSAFYGRLTARRDRLRRIPPDLERLLRVPRLARRLAVRLVRWAELAHARREAGGRGGILGAPIVRLVRLLFGRRVRRLLGSASFVVIGGARPHLDAMAFLEVMGIRCLQGWGMTETTGALAVCELGDRFRGAFGTCGRLFGDARAVLEQGELIVEGPQIARGYVEPDGGRIEFSGRFRTGDRAEFDRVGRLRILGKASERITCDNGLNYDPIPIEESIRSADLEREGRLEEVVVIGDGRPRLGAVFFARDGRTDREGLAQYVESLLGAHQRGRPPDETIACWRISEKGLREGGFLGPSGKLLRRRVAEEFDHMYDEAGK